MFALWYLVSAKNTHEEGALFTRAYVSWTATIIDTHAATAITPVEPWSLCDITKPSAGWVAELASSSCVVAKMFKHSVDESLPNLKNGRICEGA